MTCRRPEPTSLEDLRASTALCLNCGERLIDHGVIANLRQALRVWRLARKDRRR